MAFPTLFMPHTPPKSSLNHKCIGTQVVHMYVEVWQVADGADTWPHSFSIRFRSLGYYGHCWPDKQPTRQRLKSVP